MKHAFRDFFNSLEVPGDLRSLTAGSLSIPVISYQLPPALAGGSRKQQRLQPNSNKNINRPFQLQLNSAKARRKYFFLFG